MLEALHPLAYSCIVPRPVKGAAITQGYSILCKTEVTTPTLVDWGSGTSVYHGKQSDEVGTGIPYPIAFT